MKLTDEKILELASESGVVYRAHHAGCISPYIDGTDLTSFVLDFARAILKEAGVEELERDAARYRWLIENGDSHNGLFIGHGYVSTWGECGHSEFNYKDHADSAIDEAMKAK